MLVRVNRVFAENLVKLVHLVGVCRLFVGNLAKLVETPLATKSSCCFTGLNPGPNR